MAALTGLRMDYQLTISAIARRVEALFPRRPVVSRAADGTVRRGTWLSTITRARGLAAGLSALGVVPGQRVATLCWNQREHLEAYFGVPLAGAVLQPLNPRLSAADLAFVVADGGCRIVIVDQSLLDVLEAIKVPGGWEHVIVVGGTVPAGGRRYEDLLAAGGRFAEPALDERAACTLCYTSGTTGRPRGVVYSHRVIALQALAGLAADFGAISEADTILIVVPMFHANAWGHPYAAALAGASVVLPHRDVSPEAVLATVERERVTVTGAVPTVWEGILRLLDTAPGRFDLSSIRVIRIGGDRAPLRLLRALEERHGLKVLHGFGMTELGPLGGVSELPSELRGAPLADRWRARGKAGRPLPFLEVRARAGDELVPWDGDTPGELEYRGATVASRYWGDAGAENFTDDGWLRSGDIGAIDRDGVLEIRDRAKDLVKSGGEWISSVALEHALAGHPSVADAAIIAVPDPVWQERPLALVVREPRSDARPAELREHLGRLFPRWWLPDRFEFVDEIPRSPAGKIRKAELRRRFSPAGRSAGDRRST
ncbi:MAG: AMP-binding protein [Solirubrobacteraceae bacterium]